MKELNDRLKEYKRLGFMAQVEKAVKLARGETREYIERTHPQVAFGGKSLITDDYNHRTNHQAILGSYKVNATMINANIYSNYFQRWYNTGAHGNVIKYGKYKGRRGPKYPARGNFYQSNKSSIEKFYADALQRALNKFIKI